MSEINGEDVFNSGKDWKELTPDEREASVKYLNWLTREAIKLGYPRIEAAELINEMDAELEEIRSFIYEDGPLPKALRNKDNVRAFPSDKVKK